MPEPAAFAQGTDDGEISWPGPPRQESAGAAWEVPNDLADLMRRMHGVDISDVAVNRTPQAGLAASAIDARAFTYAGDVVLPSAAGPLERPGTRALLAHELTHAAQQRALGAALPPEDSAFGAALEAQALATERLAQGEQPVTQRGSAPLLHAPGRQVVASWTPPAGGPLTTAVQRQDEQAAPAPSASSTFDPFALLPRLGEPAEPTAAQANAAPEARPDGNQPGLDPALAAARDALIELSTRRLLDLDDSLAIGELADGLYRRIRARLQRELLIGRERSGLLSDFR